MAVDQCSLVCLEERRGREEVLLGESLQAGEAAE